MCLISKKQEIWDTSTPKPMPLPGERYPTTKNSRRSQVSSTSVVQSAHAQVLHPEHLEPYRTHPGAHSGAPVRSVGARYRRPLPCPSRTLLPYQDRCCGTARPVLACTTRPLHSRRMPTPRHTGTCSPRLAAPGCVAIRRRGWSHKSRWRLLREVAVLLFQQLQVPLVLVLERFAAYLISVPQLALPAFHFLHSCIMIAVSGALGRRLRLRRVHLAGRMVAQLVCVRHGRHCSPSSFALHLLEP